VVSNTYCVVFLRLVYLMLSVSLDCPSWIAPSVFSNVYLKRLIYDVKPELGLYFCNIKWKYCSSSVLKMISRYDKLDIYIAKVDTTLCDKVCQ